MSVFARRALVPVHRVLFAHRSAHVSVSIWRRLYTTPIVNSTTPLANTTLVKNTGLRVLFFGQGAVGIECLKQLIKELRSDPSCLSTIEVICLPAKYEASKEEEGGPLPKPGSAKVKGQKKKNFMARGRINKPNDTLETTSVSDVASSAGLRVRYISQAPGRPPQISFFDQHDAFKFDIAVIAMSLRQVPMNLIKGIRLGALKVHESLLPKYRGPTPMQTAILNNEEVTGVSIVECRDGRDEGRILAQVPYTVPSDTTYKDLSLALGHLGSRLLVKTLQNLEYTRKLAVQQDESQATYSPVYKTEDFKIVWETMGAKEIYRKYRAFHGFVPIHTIWRRKDIMNVLLIKGMTMPNPKLPLMTEDFYNRPPGTMFFMRKSPYIEVPCIDGDRLHLTLLRVVGRTDKTAQQFVNGYLRLNGGLRMLTNPIERKKPTPKFVYPPGHPKENVDQECLDDDVGF
ncbi:Methionyl-tRNA formyltransferase [Coemansia sp. RSA 353]|nr:Methionyl-tRNA formyltransferase [Coemansia sp. RSA 1938]KAJ2190791.1 Methionyl-tRNA formyltransferase [Coemansia sp. RSA 532]KAJ2275951.1 Methionyl-tRNA formyltransferase [Coemansia sp. RSA 371]KAJ2300778.1 Methionyl-tRNA formyltransferase [Coemansia sp. RSA 353]